jgi:raffinose/stachyose/melibiose transport system permease protein
MNRIKKPAGFKFLIFLGIPLVFYLFNVIAPIITGAYYSLFNWRGGPRKVFLGLGNYITLVHDGEFWNSLGNNLVILMFTVTGQVIFGLFAAVLLLSKYLKFNSLYRFLIFMPVMLSGVVVGTLWGIIFNKTYGLLDWFLETLGIAFLRRNWLGDPGIVMYSIGSVIVWQQIGFSIVIYLASLQNIPRDIIEMAEIDGANWFSKFIYITLPLMYNTIKVSMILVIAGNMKVFDHVFTMTKGGPGTSSSVLALYAYKKSFQNMAIGYASAVSIGTIIVSFIIILAVNKMMGLRKYETQ